MLHTHMSQEADRRPSVWGGGTQPDWYLGRWRLANDRCENCQPIAFFPQLWLLCFGPPGPVMFELNTALTANTNTA
jgi:hypothetical protein